MKETKESGKSAGENNLNRLAVGDVFMYEGSEHVVWFINESRAAIAPHNSPIKYRVREEDKKIQFLASNSSDNISPNAQVEVLRSLGRKGLAEYLDKREANISEGRSSTMKEKKKKEKGASHGKLGGYQGHSITSVIRAFGKAGWSLDEARAWFKENKIDAADNTIKIQLRRGAKGEEEPAPISKADLASMRPDVPEKSEKSSKKEKGAKKKGDKAGGKKEKKAKSDDEEEADEAEAAAKEDAEEDEE